MFDIGVKILKAIVKALKFFRLAHNSAAGRIKIGVFCLAAGRGKFGVYGLI